MPKFNIGDIAWYTEPRPPFKEYSWKILAMEPSPEDIPPYFWRCGRTNDSGVWEEKIFDENYLSKHPTTSKKQ